MTKRRSPRNSPAAAELGSAITVEPAGQGRPAGGTTRRTHRSARGESPASRRSAATSSASPSAHLGGDWKELVDPNRASRSAPVPACALALAAASPPTPSAADAAYRRPHAAQGQPRPRRPRAAVARSPGSGSRRRRRRVRPRARAAACAATSARRTSSATASCRARRRAASARSPAVERRERGRRRSAARHAGADGRTAVAPADAPPEVHAAIAAANRITASPTATAAATAASVTRGYDCSGAVSYVLHGAGLLDARRRLARLRCRWGAAGPGSWITVYANGGHAYIVIAGLRFDTSGRGERGPRWRPEPRSRRGYGVRHPEGSDARATASRSARWPCAAPARRRAVAVHDVRGRPRAREPRPGGARTRRSTRSSASASTGSA